MLTICELFQKHEAAAQASYDPSLITEAHVLTLANEAQLCEENKQYIKAFLDEADETVLRFIWRFYHFLFAQRKIFLRISGSWISSKCLNRSKQNIRDASNPSFICLQQII